MLSQSYPSVRTLQLKRNVTRYSNPTVSPMSLPRPDLTTERLHPDDAGIARGAEILRAGGLVSFPTETVYGLGGDACSETAVASIFAAKDRPSFNPLIAHVSDLEMARAYAHFSDLALRLAMAFWPGPLTIVLPLRKTSKLAELTTSGLQTVGMRMPDHTTARRLISAFGGPVAAPSANPSGRISPTTADHVIDGLDGRIDAVIDDGNCPVGVESTIVGFDGDDVILLRPGGLPIENIERCLARKLKHPTFAMQEGDQPIAPGQLTSHYAPQATVRLNADHALPHEVLLGFGPVKNAAENLSQNADLQEAAANLFTMLRRLDATRKAIAVSPIPDHGLGRAINDRLNRAAAPRG